MKTNPIHEHRLGRYLEHSKEQTTTLNHHCDADYRILPSTTSTSRVSTLSGKTGPVLLFDGFHQITGYNMYTFTYVHSHTTDTWPAVPLGLVLVVGTASLQDGLVDTTTSSNHTCNRQHSAGQSVHWYSHNPQFTNSTPALHFRSNKQLTPRNTCVKVPKLWRSSEVRKLLNLQTEDEILRHITGKVRIALAILFVKRCSWHIKQNWWVIHQDLIANTSLSIKIWELGAVMLVNTVMNLVIQKTVESRLRA